MGSSERFEYTVIGDTVNLAARLEASGTPGQVVVDAVAWDSAQEHGPVGGQVARHRSISVKGKTQPVDVVELRV